MVKKEWYFLRAPTPFEKNQFGMTCVNRKQGMSKYRDFLHPNSSRD